MPGWKRSSFTCRASASSFQRCCYQPGSAPTAPASGSSRRRVLLPPHREPVGTSSRELCALSSGSFFSCNFFNNSSTASWFLPLEFWDAGPPGWCWNFLYFSLPSFALYLLFCSVEISSTASSKHSHSANLCHSCSP